MEFTEFQRELTEFIFVKDVPQKSDIIFIPGNGYPQMSRKAAELWRAGFAPYVLPSGKYSVNLGHFTGALEDADKYPQSFETEWDFMNHILMENGVEQSAVLRENHATFTYENAICSRQITDKKGLVIRKAIICCKSVHARRCRMYYQLLFPEAELFICSSDTDSITRDNWWYTPEGIDGVMGEVTRIIKQFNLMVKPPATELK